MSEQRLVYSGCFGPLGTSAGQGGGGAGAPNGNGGDGGASAGGGGGAGNGSGGNGSIFSGGGGSPSGVAGDGGYGGGGGGTNIDGEPGNGGFGGGNGTTRRGGDGGNGFGGAIFVREGGTLIVNLQDDFGSGNTVTGGTNGDRSEASSEGEGIYLNGVEVAINVDDPDRHSISESIGGSGSVKKTGGGTLVLDGENTYSGATTISEGKLVGNTNTIPGAVVTTLGTELLIEQDDSEGDLTGDVTGSGSLVKLGSKTVTLKGTNTYSGGTFIDEGTLSGDTDSIPDQSVTFTETFEAMKSELEFDQDFDGVHSSAIDGAAGSLVKSGTGILTLTGASTFEGTTTVRGGTLQLPASASLAGAVVVDAGGTFGGAGSIGGDLTANGTVRPGDAIPSTFTVGESITFNANSTLVIETNNDVDASLKGTSNKIESVNAITIEPGATLTLALDPNGNYNGVTFEDVVKSTTSTIGGDFTIDSVSAFLDATPVKTSNALSMTIERNETTFVSLAKNGNQENTGAILDAEEDSPPSPFDSVLNTLINQATEITTPLALDAMAGTSLTGFDTARLASAEQFRNNIVRRFGYRGPDQEGAGARG